MLMIKFFNSGDEDFTDYENDDNLYSSDSMIDPVYYTDDCISDSKCDSELIPQNSQTTEMVVETSNVAANIGSNLREKSDSTSD
ncbi:hypothetical protein FQA39_LY10133 [Lamprigera yunnana]|nr:hypothetical protein FQA39_LY10133 [Lamprigera yunnana]